jgi:hypothetical protein
MTYVLWMAADPARTFVCQTTHNDVEVSTVFLGLDHNFSGAGPPVLYETMVFGGDLDHFQQRYPTRGEAAEGHRQVCLDVWGHVPSPVHPPNMSRLRLLREDS